MDFTIPLMGKIPTKFMEVQSADQTWIRIVVATRNLTSLCPNFSMAIDGYDDRHYTNCIKCGHGSEAAAGGFNKYAAGKEAVSDTVTLYGLVQCTPDLTESKCNECLIDTIKFMQNCCDTRQGGRVITPSCSFRYETNEFYKSSIAGPPVSSPTPSTSPTTQKGL
ncbi:hypothetical protein Pint_07110 [Pistacia integerrima]|uniref:Uncharacterized protein n=1 Tax=Pistacia integerrima TaxID=434235 RepID=A0ACC0XTI0_9ROSI|nr:hypothetical protein Pint_07110 [Pistacia integerrima]